MFTYCTIISGLLYLSAIYYKNIILKYILKPGTMLFIISSAIESELVKHYKLNIKTKLIGLTFSIIGDIFLMFHGDNMFILGLLSFLFAHITYIYMFNYLKKKENNNFKLFLSIISLIYFSLIFKNVLNQGGYFMIVAVSIYMITITIMVYTASLTNNLSFLIGALFFYISDAILAWNKFIYYEQNSILEYLVMITYYSAQFFIAKN